MCDVLCISRNTVPEVSPMVQLYFLLICDICIHLINYVDSSTPWDAMVSLDEFRRNYLEFECGLNATPKLANRKSSISSDLNTLVHMNSAEKHCNGIGSGAESDEFRIRRLHEYETSVVRSMNEHPTKDAQSLTPLQKLLEEVAIVLPSVFRNITGSNEPNPHLIIRPSYFDCVSDEEQLLILSTHAKDDKHSFISFSNDMAKEKTSLNWLRRIALYEDSVSLSTILLARFEWAAWESFLEFEYRTSSYIKNFTDDMIVESDAKPKSHLLSILGDVLSHCLAINDRSLTIDSSTLEGFVAPLVKTCFTEYPGVDPVKVDDVQHVILTPLSWLWFASQRCNRTTFEILDEMDKAADSSLERMDNDKEMSGMIGGSTAADSTATSDLQRKKKKKNKKRKVCNFSCFSWLFYIYNSPSHNTASE